MFAGHTTMNIDAAYNALERAIKRVYCQPLDGEVEAVASTWAQQVGTACHWFRRWRGLDDSLWKAIAYESGIGSGDRKSLLLDAREALCAHAAEHLEWATTHCDSAIHYHCHTQDGTTHHQWPAYESMERVMLFVRAEPPTDKPLARRASVDFLGDFKRPGWATAAEYLRAWLAGRTAVCRASVRDKHGEDVLIYLGVCTALLEFHVRSNNGIRFEPCGTDEDHADRIKRFVRIDYSEDHSAIAPLVKSVIGTDYEHLAMVVRDALRQRIKDDAAIFGPGGHPQSATHLSQTLKTVSTLCEKI